MVFEIIIKTTKKKEVIDITEEVSKFVTCTKAERGLAHLFLQHTTAALTTADLDPGGTELDYVDAFEAIAPKLNFRHPHNPAHMPDHVMSSLIGTSLLLPLKKGCELNLGTWQRIVLLEFDGPRERKIILTII